MRRPSARWPPAARPSTALNSPSATTTPSESIPGVDPKSAWVFPLGIPRAASVLDRVAVRQQATPPAGTPRPRPGCRVSKSGAGFALRSDRPRGFGPKQARYIGLLAGVDVPDAQKASLDAVAFDRFAVQRRGGENTRG